MRLRLPIVALTVVCFLDVAFAVMREPNPGDVRIQGVYGDILDRVIECHVKARDVSYLTEVFRQQTERSEKWHTEFWGKFMLAAVPYWQMTGDEKLKRMIDESAGRVIAAQGTDGYVGNYPKDLRCGDGWDVWGMKYTLLGLLHHYKGTGSAASLDAARKLGDFMVANLGPGAARTIGATGNFSGLPSCSALGAVIMLYRATKDSRYLDFAAFIVSEMEKHAGVFLDVEKPVWKRDEGRESTTKTSRLKAYEFMSCMQGLLDYWEETGEGRCLETAVAAGKGILDDEINLAGGASCGERWFHGAVKQHVQYASLQETCVVTTWMRFCERLLSVTGDSRWADALEVSFYNAYLAALKPDCTRFASYTPLNGRRCKGHEQCSMHTACCDANGPRGFVSVLRTALTAEGKTAFCNLYLSGSAAISLPDGGQKVELGVYTHYPLRNAVRIENRTGNSADFTLALRIPAWSSRTSVTVNGESVGMVATGSYLRLTRHWNPGDVVELVLDMTPRTHRLDHAVAFTRGPIALVRDSRFNDGDIGETLRPWAIGKDFKLVLSPVVRHDNAFRMVFAAELELSPSQDAEWPDDNFGHAVRFCDYASGAATWSPASWCRMWFPIERSFCE